MAEYIDKAEYCEKHCRCSNEYCDRQSCPIWEAPAADVAPVVHGRWEWLGPNRLVTDCMCGTCSACKVRSKYIANTMLCPNCGAKMDDVQQLAGELNHAAQCVAEGYVTWADIRQMLKEYGVESALE